jgi:uncharacterized heparinase superfamily protein
LDDIEPAPFDTASNGGVRHFPDAGLVVVRDARRFLLVSNGPVGTAGFGNHKHNDLLGFEYHVDGHAVVVDPGSYVYTADPDARNLFRGTGSHNTLSIDGDEQNEFRPEWLFRMFEKAHPDRLEIADGAEALTVRGRHSGYMRLPQGVAHQRTFALSRQEGTLAVRDVLDGRGTHTLRWHFHFSPGVELTTGARDTFVIRVHAIELSLTIPSGLRPAIVRSSYSPSYGVRLPCLALDVEGTVGLEGTSEFLFRFES